MSSRPQLGTVNQKIIAGSGVTLTPTGSGVSIVATGKIAQIIYIPNISSTTGTNVYPDDTTMPVIGGEGDCYMIAPITPKALGNTLFIEACGHYSHTAVSRLAQWVGAAASGSTTLAVTRTIRASSNVAQQLFTLATLSVVSLASQSYVTYSGDSGAGTTTFNGQAGSSILGGLASYMRITEVAP